VAESAWDTSPFSIVAGDFADDAIAGAEPQTAKPPANANVARATVKLIFGDAVFFFICRRLN
jgi:hypothetical protein